MLAQAFDKAKNEAGSAHALELQQLRTESQATMEQLRTAHTNSLKELEASQAEALESAKKAFEKKLAELTMELKATQDDLGKAKSALTASQSEGESQRTEIQRLSKELEESKGASSDNQEKDVQIEGLRKQLSVMADDLEATKMAFTAQKESFHEMAESHQRDLEEAAKSRVEAVQELKKQLDEEKAGWAAEKRKLVQELEDERVAKEQAKAEAHAAQTALQTPPMSPKANGQPSQHVPREELLKVHEAHTTKMAEVDAAHTKEVTALKKQIADLTTESNELKNTLSSRNLELQFLGDEKTELEEEVERLKHDLNSKPGMNLA